MEIADRYWLAGLLEGEGCFQWSRCGEKTWPRIALAMGDKDVVIRAALLLGGRGKVRTFHSYGRNPVHRFVVSGKRAVEVMTELLSIMGERRQSKIKELLGG